MSAAEDGELDRTCAGTNAPSVEADPTQGAVITAYQMSNIVTRNPQMKLMSRNLFQPRFARSESASVTFQNGSTVAA